MLFTACTGKACYVQRDAVAVLPVITEVKPPAPVARLAPSIDIQGVREQSAHSLNQLMYMVVIKGGLRLQRGSELVAGEQRRIILFFFFFFQNALSVANSPRFSFA